MKRHPLGRTGIEVPALSMGAAALGSVYNPVSQDDADAAIAAALELGIDYFDVAPYYGMTTAETALGKALAPFDRSSYHLATKIGRYGDKEWDFSADATKRSVEASLKRLGTDHIDVIQCHDIECGDVGQMRAEALPALRRLREEGVVGHIGITGYDLKLVETVAIEERVDTVMTYCLYTLQDRRLAPVAERLAAAGIGVLNASPLGMGLLTQAGAPWWHPGNERVHELTKAAARLCAAAGTDLSAVAIAFAVATGAAHGISTTVAGASNPAEVRNGVHWAENPPDPALLAQIEAILEPVIGAGWDVLPGNGGKAGR